jgi:hypothetical protein
MRKPGFLRLNVRAMIIHLIGAAAFLCAVHDGELESC